MIYTARTIKAMRLAYQAHQGQYDKGGAPYILHPVHLAEQMETEDETIVALLHDVVEDGGILLRDLVNEFGADIALAVHSLTNYGGCSYKDYIARVAKNPIARKVKIADLKHNMDLSRVMETEETMSYPTYKRMQKYRESLEYLNKGG